MKNVEHIGIAVKNLGVSVPLFEKLLNKTVGSRVHVSPKMHRNSEPSITFFQEVV